jgi:HK97 family phage portal protein
LHGVIFQILGFFKHTLSYFYPQLRGSLENPSTPLSAWVDDGIKTTSKILVTEEKALSIGAYYSCLKVLSETMASMDLEVVQRVGKATRASKEHPNYWLLHAYPSPIYNRFEWVQSMVFWAASWGNGYSEIIRDRFANAIELRLIPSYDVTPKLTKRNKLFYEIRDENGNTRVVLSDNMVHLKNIGTNGITGISTVNIQRESIGNSLAKQQHEGAFYANGAKASGILMTPGTMGLKEKDNLTNSFNRVNEGSQNRFKTIVLEEGVKYQQLTIPQNDAQFLESKKFDRSEIAGWFRIPPHKIGDLEKANYSNIEAQDRAFAKDVAVPWAERFQQELNRKLFFDFERDKFTTQFNLDDLIKGDIKTRYEVYATGVQWGILKPTEPREQEGWEMEGTEEIDKFFMNSTMVPVGILGMKPEHKEEENEAA